MVFKAHTYQTAAIRWVIDKPRCALLLDMGLGKSVITLTAISQLIDDGDITKALVVAPKKVAETTWTAEAEKWDHTRHLRVSKVIGTETQRRKALMADADVYVTGRDNFVWLVKAYKGRLPFDMIVLDELTSFKSNKSLRFKAIRLVAPSIGRIVGLTGTPAPNGLIDMWAQIYCIDQGARLGKSMTRYRDTYFSVVTWNNIAIKATPKPGAADTIKQLISDICLSMQAKDYLQLPKMVTHSIYVHLSPKVQKGYNDFERDMVMTYKAEKTEGDVIANSAAGLMNKLSQYANGAVYDDDRNVVEVHDEKLERLTEIIEAANGSSVLVFYQYQHDVPRITKALKGYKVRKYDKPEDLTDWNNGEIDVLLAHPASTAYGLNMQQGGHYIVWYGTGWNLEYYQQANARLYRQGQTHTVIIYRLICKDTVDERAERAIDGKATTQQALLDALKYLESKYEEEN